MDRIESILSFPKCTRAKISGMQKEKNKQWSTQENTYNYLWSYENVLKFFKQFGELVVFLMYQLTDVYIFFFVFTPLYIVTFGFKIFRGRENIFEFKFFGEGKRVKFKIFLGGKNNAYIYQFFWSVIEIGRAHV